MYSYYLIFMLLLLVCGAFAVSASNKVRKTFTALSDMPTRSRMSGYDTAVRLLRAGGVHDISVGRVKGFLTDHFHPAKKQVNLSESVYGNDSVASVAVAAHEIGHVMQKEKGYLPYKLRSVLVGITNFGSRLALPLVLLGLILDIFVYTTARSNVGFYLALTGVALYGLSTVFALVTLPVERNASRRAEKMLIEEGILMEEELPYAERMLDAAGMTYVASLLTSLVYFLRFAVWVLILFGGRSRRD